MVAAVADGEPVLDVFARFAAQMAFSVSKLRTMYRRCRDERVRHNASSLLRRGGPSVILRDSRL